MMGAGGCTAPRTSRTKINGDFFSLWESKEKYDTYLQWRMDSGVMEESAEFLDGEPVWRFF